MVKTSQHWDKVQAAKNLEKRLRRIKKRRERKIPPLFQALKDERPQLRPFDYVLSHSQIKQWRICRQQWYYSQIENLRPRIKGERLKLGDELHQLFESYSIEGEWKKKYRERQEAYGHLLPAEQEAYSDILPNAKVIMSLYERKYRDDILDYKFVEQKFGPAELVHTALGRIGFVFIPDAIIQRKGKLWLLERKSHSEFPDPGIRLIDTQTMLYVYGLRQLGWDIRGIVWDEVRTKVPRIPQTLKNGTISRRKNIDTTWGTYRKTILNNGQNPKDYLDMKKLLKNREKRFLRRQWHPVRESILQHIVKGVQASAIDLCLNRDKPIKEIGRHCLYCDFKVLCHAEVMGNDVEFIKKAEFINAKNEKKVTGKIS